MSKFTIKKISGREILDSRGNPTIETKVVLENNIIAKASVPSGASTGVHEAYELRDKEKRYNGMGVLKAIKNINTKINSSLKGCDVRFQEKIDKKLISLDGTKNKKKLGANAILGVSLACCRAGSIVKKQPLYKYIAENYKLNNNYKLPIPTSNIFNGGKHADTNLDFQEFMITPIKKNGKAGKTKKVFSEHIQMCSEIFHELGNVLKKRGLDTDVGNEGGYAPDIYSSIQGLDLIMAATINAGYAPGKDIGISIDVGSSVLYDKIKRKYIFKLDQSMFTNSTWWGFIMNG